MKCTSKITEKNITYQIEDKWERVNGLDYITKEIFYWYNEYVTERGEPPTIFDLTDEFERLKKEEILDGFRDDYGYAEIMFDIYETEDVEEIARREIQEIYKENQYLINDLISEVYHNLGLSLLFHDSDFGFIDSLDFASFYLQEDLLILGAQVPVFRTLRSDGSGSPLSDEFYGGV